MAFLTMTLYWSIYISLHIGIQYSNPHCKQTESQYLFFSILETVCCNTQRCNSPLFYCVILKKIRETYSHVN
jgi:hypothetical protein